MRLFSVVVLLMHLASCTGFDAVALEMLEAPKKSDQNILDINYETR